MVPINPAGPTGSNGTGFSFCTQKKVLQRGFKCVRHPPWAMVVPGGGGGPPLSPRKFLSTRCVGVTALSKTRTKRVLIWGPGSWQNIPNFVCTQNFGYKTLVFGFIEPLRRHVCGWLGLAGASRRESGSGWVSCRHDGLRAVRNQRS